MTTVTPLDCATVIAQLWDFLDDEVDAVRWQAMREHLATCTGCAAHVAFCRSFLEQVAIAQVDPEELAALRARITAALA